MGKYNDWTRGEGEALLNIVGGVDIARVVLRGERKLTVEKITKVVKKHDLFTTSEEQIRRLLDINEAVWHDTDITEEAIRELGDPPECPVSDEKGLYCVVLLYETGDVVKTFRRNWEACVHVRGEDSTWNWDGLLFTPQGVRQRQGAILRPVGLRWAVVELGRRFQGQSVEGLRPQLGEIMGMGQELPLVAALNPKWAVSMNGKDIPYVDAPDLEVTPGGRGGFVDAPFLYFDSGSGEFELHSCRTDRVYSSCGSASLQ